MIKLSRLVLKEGGIPLPIIMHVRGIPGQKSTNTAPVDFKWAMGYWISSVTLFKRKGQSRMADFEYPVSPCRTGSRHWLLCGFGTHAR
jgi:hypothetical protein